MDGWIQDLCFPVEQKLGHGGSLFVADGSAGIVQVTPKGNIDLATKRYLHEGLVALLMFVITLQPMMTSLSPDS